MDQIGEKIETIKGGTVEYFHDNYMVVGFNQSHGQGVIVEHRSLIPS